MNWPIESVTLDVLFQTVFLKRDDTFNVKIINTTTHQYEEKKLTCQTDYLMFNEPLIY